MKRIICLFLLFAVVAVASAASFTLTLTDSQVAAIQYAYSVAPDRAKYADAQGWFSSQLAINISALEQKQKTEQAGDFCTRFKSQSQDDQDKVCAALKLSPGCGC